MSHVAGGLSFHRADFLDCLVKHLDNDVTRTYFKKRLQFYTKFTNEVESIMLSFTDGTTAKCDVLVGADGIHSATRRCLLDRVARAWKKQPLADALNNSNLLLKKKEPIWSGFVSYRALIPSEKLRAVNPNHSAFSSINAVSGLTDFDDPLAIISVQYTGRNKVK